MLNTKGVIHYDVRTTNDVGAKKKGLTQKALAEMMNESYRQLAESHVQIITQQQQLNAITMKQLPAPDTETDEIPTKPKRRWVFFWKK